MFICTCGRYTIGISELGGCGQFKYAYYNLTFRRINLMATLTLYVERVGWY